MEKFVYNRNFYLQKILPFMDKPVIKVITGMRRIGKSYFVRQLIGYLKDRGISEKQIVYINKELLDFDFIKTYQDLNHFVKTRFSQIAAPKYLFLDEVQEIVNWEKAIADFLVPEDIDIYITGSNAHLLSSELATQLSGRYLEFPIYALSLDEFRLFRNEPTLDPEKNFLHYLKFGGFPAIHHFNLNEELIYQYINSIYNTILLKDVVARNKIRNVQLLENIMRYVFQNIGNIFSAKKVSDYLKSQRLQVSIDTVQRYLSCLQSTFMLYKVPRFDVKGKRVLEIYEKYYLGDIGLRHALLGYREADIAMVLENIVFLELKRRGYQVFIGKYDDFEIDFIAEKAKEKLYLQVAYLLATPAVIEREFNPLQRIQDNYPKYVLSLDRAWGEDFEGIHRRYLVDFLLEVP